jgi:tRNA(adenine34) deaminase
MEPQDEAFMKLAIAQARHAHEEGDVPFGAVIVQGLRVVAAVGNSEHTDQDVTRHAEVKAVSLASQVLGRRDLSDCTLYATTEPCPMCAGAMFHACINRVVYGMSRDDLPDLFRSRNIRLKDLATDWHYTPTVIEGVLRQEAIEVFLSYKQPFRVKPQQFIAKAA